MTYFNPKIIGSINFRNVSVRLQSTLRRNPSDYNLYKHRDEELKNS